MSESAPIRPRLVALGLALAGAAAFALPGLPLPFLFGPMAFCLVAALCGVRLAGLPALAPLARAVVGVAAGAAFTPATLAAVPAMAPSLALVPVYVALVAAVGMPLFRRLGFDAPTAWYASMPGGLQDMVFFGAEAGGNARALSLVHATRVLVLVTAAPVVLTLWHGMPLGMVVGTPALSLPPAEIAALVFAVVVGWKGGERIGLFGASLVGPMILGAVLGLTGLLHVRPPAEAIAAAQLVLGLGIGVTYVGVTLAELRRTIAVAGLFVAVLAVVTVLFAEAVVLAGIAAPVDAFLAFAPGGQAEMAVLAILAGADVGFVVLHHLLRIAVTILGAPVAARLVGVRRRG